MVSALPGSKFTREDPASRAVSGSGARTPQRDGLRDALAVAPALLVFGATLGILIRSTSTGDGAGLLGAPLVYGGSAQLTATTLYARGAGLLVLLASAGAVNARLLLYSAALAHRFNGQPSWFRVAGPHVIIDQTYLAAQARPDLVGRGFRCYWLSVGLGVMAVWTLAVGVGILAGPLLPPLPHLSLVGIALFLGMLVSRSRGRPARAAALTAGVVAPIAAHLLFGAGVIVGTVAGIAVGSLTRKGRTT